MRQRTDSFFFESLTTRMLVNFLLVRLCRVESSLSFCFFSLLESSYIKIIQQSASIKTRVELGFAVLALLRNGLLPSGCDYIHNLVGRTGIYQLANSGTSCWSRQPALFFWWGLSGGSGWIVIATQIHSTSFWQNSKEVCRLLECTHLTNKTF